ncbi:hypothetical protein BBK14_11350 [Parafrankia soli]|uniref:Uncharacterized protein n=1 Tax=Parafrankia soli TaxID=2599596 RepID=A0A1S1R7Q6_9ACTN|nr:hypothetical protein [Parafrankia soli]OHV42210.1 hypothetical protein BBK14_11350 [Parafrankia soli]
MIPADDETPAGPYDRPRPFVTSAAVWDPANIPDGSSTQVNLETGELIHIPPSETRRRRLEARQRQHEARLEAERAEAAAAARRGAALARAALPPRPTPVGLIRDTGPLTIKPSAPVGFMKPLDGSAGQTA